MAVKYLVPMIMVPFPLTAIPERDSHPLDYATLPGRTGALTP